MAKLLVSKIFHVHFFVNFDNVDKLVNPQLCLKIHFLIEGLIFVYLYQCSPVGVNQRVLTTEYGDDSRDNT